MAMDVPPELKSFVQVPYVVQAAAGAEDLMRRAATALAKLGRPGATLGFGEASGFGPRRGSPASGTTASSEVATPSAGSGQGPAETLSLGATTPMATADFHALVVGVERRLDRDLPKVKGYRIAIFDASAPDMGKEVVRALGDKRADRGFLGEYRQMGGQGGFATPYDAGKEQVCLVVGMKPSTTIAGFVGGFLGGEINTGAATSRDLHTHLQWHEVGHCLLGGSEMRADTFGALMAVQSGASRDTIATVANMREAAELMRSDVMDDHVTSRAVAFVARMYDKLKADPAFMAMDVKGVAAVAKTVADRFAPGPKGLMETAKARLAINVMFGMRAHFVMEAHGMAAMNAGEYMRANRDKVGLFARLLDLRTRLSDMTVPPTDYAVDLATLRRELGTVAVTGDPTATEMLRALDAPIPAKGFDRRETMHLAYGMDGGEPMATKYFALDASNVKVTFSSDQSTFAVRDGVTGTVAMHDVVAGRTHEVVREAASTFAR